MIQNERQREITERWIARFSEALERLREHLDDGDENRRKLRRIEAAGIESEIGVLKAQVAEYDDLRSGRVKVMPFVSLHDLPKALIKARIASGVSQREIADLLGIDEKRFV